MSIISEKFNLKINSLKSDFQINKDVNHNGIKGGLNENELSELIKEVIPQKYKITRGIIENSNGDQSNETDIFIYDNEILPAYIKNELTFVPVEAVKYIFEVKSILNSSELKTTISKFEKFKLIGGRSPTVLFSFSTDIKGSELSRYKNQDINFFANPAITVLCSSNKCYYFKDTKEHYLKDYISPEEFIKQFSKISGLDIENSKSLLSDIVYNDKFLNQLTRSQFALLLKASILSDEIMTNFNQKNLTVNGIDYSTIKFKTHKWIGIESIGNNVEMSFLSGISNTLSKESFGKYLLGGKDLHIKIFSICYEDMWGNISCQDYSEEGLKYNPDEVSISFVTSNNENKIIFKPKFKNDG